MKLASETGVRARRSVAHRSSEDVAAFIKQQDAMRQRALRVARDALKIAREAKRLAEQAVRTKGKRSPRA
jgi:hypothetical protein